MANIDPGDTTMHACKTLVATLLLAGMACAPPAVRAAQSYDNCTGFIESLPTTISTSGVWCLHHDLATSISTGNAIEIATNNVTIDCNDFKIDGLAAGTASVSSGIYAYNKKNATIRRCDIRGFYFGINFAGNDAAGHLVEDNRLDNNLNTGIYVYGTHNRILRNAVFNTGGYANSAYPTSGSVSYGIFGSADIIGNTVETVFTAVATNTVFGIQALGNDTLRVRDNRVSGLTLNSGGVAIGIGVPTSIGFISGNRISATNDATNGNGINGMSLAMSFCRDNTISRFATAMKDCTDDGGNGLH